MKRILVLEDNDDSYHLIQRVLLNQVVLQRASSVEQAVRLVSQSGFDFYIVDLTLPDGDGFSFIQKLKNLINNEAPILILTASGDLQNKLLGFDLGVIDYVVKPFEPLELKARVLTRLNLTKNSQVLREGPLEIDLLSHKAYEIDDKEKQELDLTQIEFKILRSLLEKSGQLLTREQLLDQVWGESVYVDLRTVDAHVSRLRKKIQKHREVIRSVHGQGYRLDVHP